MKKKETTYQKLKRENLKLKLDIYDILGRNGFEKEITAKHLWKVYFDTENMIWGAPNIKQKD